MNFFCSQSGVTLLSASLLPPGVGTACTACFILHQIAFLMRAQLGFLPQMKFLKDAYGAILFSCHIYTGVMVERLKIMKLTYTPCHKFVMGLKQIVLMISFVLF